MSDIILAIFKGGKRNAGWQPNIVMLFNNQLLFFETYFIRITCISCSNCLSKDSASLS